MVPESFHDFFVASAGVSGALIGLLFVAVSISAERVAGPGADLRLQLRAGAAFSVLVNPLVVSLAALVPDTQLFVAPLGAALVGIGSNVVMLAIIRRRSVHVGLHELVLQSALILLYVFEAASALQLHSDPTDVGAVKTQATLVIVLFLVGISRAWELIIGRRHSLVSSFGDLQNGMPTEAQ